MRPRPKWKPIEWAEESGQIRASLGPFLERRAARTAGVGLPPACSDPGTRLSGAVHSRPHGDAGALSSAGASWRADFEGELSRFPAACTTTCRRARPRRAASRHDAGAGAAEAKRSARRDAIGSTMMTTSR